MTSLQVLSCSSLAGMALLFGVASAPVVSQMPVPAAGQLNQQAPSSEVVIDLAVRDKRNRPVIDLQPAHISITDNGVPVKLTNLRLMNGKPADEPLITLLFDRPGMEGNQKDSDNSLLGGSSGSPRESSDGLRRAATKFLKPFPAAGFQFAVMDAWGRLQIQQEYTADRKAISQAVSVAVKPEKYGTKVTANAIEQRIAQIAKTGQDSAGAPASTRERALARSMLAALQSSTRVAKDQHLSLSLACLLALVESQESLPGRKAIIYFPSQSGGSGNSTGKTSKDTRGKEALSSIIGAANRSGVNIYLVRQEDLTASNQMAAMMNSFSAVSSGSANLSMTSGQGGMGQIPGPNMYSIAAAGQFASGAQFQALADKRGGASLAHDNLNSLAAQTGGDVLNAGENISGQVKDLVLGLKTYYVASYVPPTGVEDGSFHATVVKTSRKGLKVRTRTGYLALPPNAGLTDAPQPFELPLMALLRNTELPGELEYHAAVLRMGHQEEGNVNVVAMEAPVNALHVREDTATHLSSAHISVLANIKDSTGTVIERFSEDISRRWSAASASGTAPEFISFQRSFLAPPGAYILETAMLDNNSGKAAASRQPFEITAPRELPEVSDLVMARGMEPAQVDDNEPEPLLYGDQRVLPNLERSLPSGAHKVSLFFLAHTDPKSQEPATVKVEVLRDGVPLKGEPLSRKLNPGAEYYPVLNSFTISSAANGQYQVRATVTQGGKSSESRGEFELIGEAAHSIEGGGAEAPLMADPPGLEAADQTIDRPGAEDVKRILADVGKNATEYGDALPNLICEQTTARSEDARGDGTWKHKDTIAEVLTYVDHEEKRTVVAQEENQQKLHAGDSLSAGMVSAGEFGQALSGIFRPASKAEFTWKQTGMLRGEAVEVFEYKIPRGSSTFSLNAATGSAMAGYHGRVYVDRATHGVRSVTLITDDVPKNFSIHRAAVRVDYDYVSINDHDYLLPVSAQVVVGRAGNLLERNDLEFSNFRRFGSSLRILDSGTGEK